MPILAKPESSQLLLIDPVPQSIAQLPKHAATRIAEQFTRLTAAADKALVPRYFAVSQGVDNRDGWLSTPCEKNKLRVFRFEHDRSVWSNPGLLEAVNRENRPQLYICGFWLDDVVTAAALEAHASGFDTHVIVDLSFAHGCLSRRASIDRLTRYDIVPIYLRNLLYEWMARTDDTERRAALREYWQQQRDFDRKGASASRTGLS